MATAQQISDESPALLSAVAFIVDKVENSNDLIDQARIATEATQKIVNLLTTGNGMNLRFIGGEDIGLPVGISPFSFSSRNYFPSAFLLLVFSLTFVIATDSSASPRAESFAGRLKANVASLIRVHLSPSLPSSLPLSIASS